MTRRQRQRRRRQDVDVCLPRQPDNDMALIGVILYPIGYK